MNEEIIQECETEVEPEVTLEDIMEALKLKLDNSDIFALKLNKNKVKQGIDDVSYTVGQVLGLAQMNIPPKACLDYILSLRALDSQDKQIESQIDIAKYAGLKAEQEGI